ncbi:MAG: (Fe-S)-binding protein, partial [Flavisolibacter sp.]
KLGSMAPAIYNMMMTAPVISSLIKKLSGFATARSIPTMYKTTLKQWWKKHNKFRMDSSVQSSEFKTQYSNLPGSQLATRNSQLFLFCDEFTNYNDTEIGIKAILLLEKLGYEVIIPEHIESGRAWLSKGLVRKAKEIANKNIELLGDLITADTPLIGIEPSAILTFRDEYVDLADNSTFEKAKQLSTNVFLIDEFISNEIEKGNISKDQFTNEKKQVVLHGHCQQKALSSVATSVKILSLPENYSVDVIPSGCCGMAGSFGYEKEHYDISMKIGELVLFPTIRKQSAETIIAAPGTSCRHQVKDGTGRHAKHTVEVLYEALI